MKSILLYITLATSIYLVACNKESFVGNSKAQLTFSTDTVLFDTVFVSTGSITKRVKVFNPTNQNILIDEIFLGSKRFGNKSNYRLNINGFSVNEIKNLEIRANDSIYIFAEVTIDPNASDLPFLVMDSILLSTGANYQSVYLAAYGRNAIFLNNALLDCNTSPNLTWNNTRPIVIYNSALIPKGCNLTIEAGTEVYLNNNSFLFVEGSLTINGNKDNPVQFRSVRLDKFYRDFSGLWGGIKFESGSINNRISYANIQNGTFGVLILDSSKQTPATTVSINNSIIGNMAVAGILSIDGNVTATNTLVSDCGQFTFYGYGGAYNFTHCTFGGVGEFTHTNPTFLFSNSNLYDADENYVRSLGLNATLTNCIVWGNQEEEIILDNGGKDLPFTSLFDNNIIKTKKPIDRFGNGNILNRDPKFRSPSQRDYTIDTLSSAYLKGKAAILAFDLRDTMRNPVSPTIGCYERIE